MEEYTKKTLQSGREVFLRPLSWQDFWSINLAQNQILQEKEGLAAADILTRTKELREMSLASCVKNWGELASSLSLPEVLEMETLIDEISKSPILKGNSLPVVDTTQTATE